MELGNNAKYIVKGFGTIVLQMQSRGSFEVKDVFFVLGHKKNLLSTLAMDGRGYAITF